VGHVWTKQEITSYGSMHNEKWKHAILVPILTDGWAGIDDPNNLLPVYDVFMEEVSECQPCCLKKIFCVPPWKQV
jgi:hypothetical protein